MKLFQMPINDPRLETMTEEQMNLMLWMDIVNDPARVRKLDEIAYDPNFDKEWDALKPITPDDIENSDEWEDA